MGWDERGAALAALAAENGYTLTDEELNGLIVDIAMIGADASPLMSMLGPFGDSPRLPSMDVRQDAEESLLAELGAWRLFFDCDEAEPVILRLVCRESRAAMSALTAEEWNELRDAIEAVNKYLRDELGSDGRWSFEAGKTELRCIPDRNAGKKALYGFLRADILRFFN